MRPERDSESWKVFRGLAGVAFLIGAYLFPPAIFLVPFAYFSYVVGRQGYYARFTLHVENEKLVKKNKKGRIVGTIDLRYPCTVDYVHKGYFEAIYRLDQNGEELYFSTMTGNCESVVRDVLRFEWPPVSRYMGF